MPVTISRPTSVFREIPTMSPTSVEWSDPYEYIQVCQIHIAVQLTVSRYTEGLGMSSGVSRWCRLLVGRHHSVRGDPNPHAFNRKFNCWA